MSVRIEQRKGETVLIEEGHNNPCAIVKEEGLKVLAKDSRVYYVVVPWKEIEAARRQATLTPVDIASG